MGELSNIWMYQEDTIDLKMKLQNTRMELETMRHEVNLAKEQTRKKEKQLHELIQMVYKERDEAREKLMNLLNKINTSSNVSTLKTHLIMIDSNQLNQKLQHPRTNSSITESNTLSDTYNNLNNTNNSYVSSPVDSIFDAVTSPDFSTFNNNMVSDNNVTFVQDICQSHCVIDGLVKGKILPQKGKLLEAVMEAGPLLQTLMLAGPLPRWRNPPPLQPFKIPQMAVIAAMPDNNHHHHFVAATMRHDAWTPFAEMSCGSSSHMETNNFSMSNFNNGCVNNERLMMNMNTQIPVGKRQRLM